LVRVLTVHRDDVARAHQLVHLSEFVTVRVPSDVRQPRARVINYRNAAFLQIGLQTAKIVLVARDGTR